MTACDACGTELPASAKFCLECGAPVALSHSQAEYKQVTVLFADVVHSMDIAAAVGAERLREARASWCGCGRCGCRRPAVNARRAGRSGRRSGFEWLARLLGCEPLPA